MSNVLSSAPEAQKQKKQTDDKESVRRVCFVCTGNTCRSPMAAAVANALANEPLQALPESVRALASPEIEAFSAGLFANEGEPIAQNAVDALEAAGIPVVSGHDYKKHTAHTLCAEEAERYDLIVGLTAQHAFRLMMQYPHLTRRITSMPTDIADPYGGDGEVYRKCLEQITQAVQKLLFPAAGGAE